jgi:hypothetical protein
MANPNVSNKPFNSPCTATLPNRKINAGHNLAISSSKATLHSNPAIPRSNNRAIRRSNQGIRRSNRAIRRNNRATRHNNSYSNQGILNNSWPNPKGHLKRLPAAAS